jgi:uncharacterized membrane protein YphA (DoxX/SURF4 family)
MSVVATIAAVVVGAALVAAGVFKLMDGPAWPKQAADMGVAAPIARVVPFVEIVIGVLLILPVFRPWPAIAAIVLLVVFTMVILRRLLDGSRPPCACFGSRSNRPLGPIHVLRNVILLALATTAAIWG